MLTTYATKLMSYFYTKEFPQVSILCLKLCIRFFEALEAAVFVASILSCFQAILDKSVLLKGKDLTKQFELVLAYFINLNREEANSYLARLQHQGFRYH